MEFLGVGYQEILLIFVLLLVVVGPERLPHMAYQMGKAVREMQKYARAVRDEFSDEMGYFEEQYRTVRGEFDEARTEMRDQSRALDRELRDQTETLDREVKEASKDAEESVAPEGRSKTKQGRGNVVPISSARTQGTAKGTRQPAAKAATGTDGDGSDAESSDKDQGDEQAASQQAEKQDSPPLVF